MARSISGSVASSAAAAAASSAVIAPDVVAQPGPQPADRAAQADDIGVSEREGGLVVLDRLAVREDRRRPRTGEPERLRGLGRRGRRRVRARR